MWITPHASISGATKHVVHRGVMFFVLVVVVSILILLGNNRGPVFTMVETNTVNPYMASLTGPNVDFLFTVISHQGQSKHWPTIHQYWNSVLSELDIRSRAIIFACDPNKPVGNNETIILKCGDGYSDFAEKTAAIRKYVATNLNFTFNYVVKVDSDVIINPSEFQKWLNQYNGVKKMYGGHFWVQASVRTDDKGDDPVVGEILRGYYPKYGSGPFYILSEDLLRFMVKADSLMEPRHFYNEDTYVGYMVGSRHGVTYAEYSLGVLPDDGECPNVYCHTSEKLDFVVKIMQRKIKRRNLGLKL